MKNATSIYRIQDLLNRVNTSAVNVDGEYLPSRPVGMFSIASRIRCAYMVFCGKADAIIWPEDDWERANLKARAALARVGATP